MWWQHCRVYQHIACLGGRRSHEFESTRVRGGVHAPGRRQPESSYETKRACRSVSRVLLGVRIILCLEGAFLSCEASGFIFGFYGFICSLVCLFSAVSFSCFYSEFKLGSSCVAFKLREAKSKILEG